MTLLSFLASISGVVLRLAGFPQVIKIFKTKSAKDIAPSEALRKWFNHDPKNG